MKVIIAFCLIAICLARGGLRVPEVHDEQAKIKFNLDKALQDGLKAAQIFSTLRGEEAKIHFNLGKALGDALTVAQVYKHVNDQDEKIKFNLDKALQDAMTAAQIYKTLHGEEAKIHINVDKILGDAMTAAQIYKTLHGEEAKFHINMDKVLGDAMTAAQIYKTLHGEEAKIHINVGEVLQDGLTAAQIFKTLHGEEEKKKIDWEKLLGEGLQIAGKLAQGSSGSNSEFDLHDEQEKIHINIGKVLGDTLTAAKIISTVAGDAEKSKHKIDWEKLLGEGLQIAGKLAHASAGSNSEFVLHNEEAKIHVNVGAILQDGLTAAQIFKTLHGEEAKFHFNLGKALSDGLTAAKIISTVAGDAEKSKINWANIIAQGLKSFSEQQQNSEFDLHDDQEKIHINIDKVLGDAMTAAQIYKTLHGEEEKIHFNLGSALKDGLTAAQIYATVAGEEAKLNLKKVDWEKLVEEGLKVAGSFEHKSSGSASNSEFALHDEQEKIHFNIGKVLGDTLTAAKIISTVAGDAEKAKKAHKKVELAKLLSEGAKIAAELAHAHAKKMNHETQHAAPHHAAPHHAAPQHAAAHHSAPHHSAHSNQENQEFAAIPEIKGFLGF